MLERLAERVPVELSVLGPALPRLWPTSLASVTRFVAGGESDVGVVERDDVRVDREATVRRVEGWLDSSADLVARERERLGGGYDLALCDVPSAPIAAAADAGVVVAALANFSWDWIYRNLGLEAAAERCWSMQARASLLLEAQPSAPMGSFARRRSVGLVARRLPESGAGRALRGRLGIAPDRIVVLVAFRASGGPELRLPRPRSERVFLFPAGWSRPLLDGRDDVRVLGPSDRFEDAIVAADLVVGKPGYGLIGDVESAASRFLFVSRPGFPENAVLETYLCEREATAGITPGQLASGRWGEELERLLAGPRPPRRDCEGADRAAEALAELLAGLGSGRGSPASAPRTRGCAESARPS